jgi:hypothetical protein
MGRAPIFHKETQRGNRNCAAMTVIAARNFVQYRPAAAL